MNRGALSSTQLRMWFAERSGAAHCAYVLPFATRLRGPLRCAALQAALRQCVADHTALRTAFTPTSDGLAQSCVRPAHEMAPALRLRPLAADGEAYEARVADAFARAVAHARKPMDVRRAPLLRPALFRIADDDHVLALPLHHMAGDGASLAILHRELVAHYTALSAGRRTTPREPAVFLALTERGSDERAALCARAVKDFLGTPPAAHSFPPDFPPDRATLGNGGDAGRGHDVHRTLPPSLVAEVGTLCAQCRATPFTMHAALLQVLLARHNGQDEGVIGLMAANRLTRASRTVIGPFANPLPLRADASGDPPFPELLTRLGRSLRHALRHNDLRLDDLVRALRPHREAGRHPVFQVMLNDVSLGGPLPMPGEGTSTPLLLDAGTSWLDLELCLRPAESGGLDLHAKARADLFARDTVVRLLEEYEALVRAVCRTPQARVSDLRVSHLPTAADRRENLVAETPSDAVTGPVSDASAPPDGAAPPTAATGEPLSPAQQALWIRQVVRSLDAARQSSVAVEITGLPDRSALRRALDHVVDEHPPMRSCPRRSADGRWHHAPHPQGAVVTEAALPSTPEPIPPALVREAARPFRAGEPLHRCVLWEADDMRTVLQLTVHDVALDSLAWQHLLTRLHAHYQALTGDGPAAPLPKTQRPAQEPDGRDAADAFWQHRHHLAASRPALPPDGEDTTEGRGLLVCRTLPEGSADALGARAGALGVEPFTLVLTGVAAALRMVAGEDECALLAPVGASATRTSARRTVPLRFQLDASSTIDDLARQAHAEVHDAARRLDGPLPEVADAHAPVVVDLLDPEGPSGFSCPRTALDRAGLEWRPYLVHHGTARQDLAVYVGRDEGRLTLAVEYRADRYRTATADAFADLVTGALTAVVDAGQGTPVLEFPRPASPPNAEGPGVPHGATSLAEDFRAQAYADPDHICLLEDAPDASQARTWTYAQLASAAETLAARLTERGAVPGVVVGILAPRSLELFAGVYGALLADAPFLLLDPELPEARLRHMVDDSRVALLVEAADAPALFGTGTDEADRSDEAGAAETCDVAPGVRVRLRRVGAPRPLPLATTDPADTAYVMYTSGSTGRPKGVAVSRRGLANRVRWMQDAFRLDARSRVLAKTPLSFDVCVWELLWPATSGATCVLARHGAHGDAAYLAEAVVRHGIDTVHFVPTMLTAFLEVARPGRGPLRRVITSGERLTLDQARAAHQRLGVCVHNLYGPTEAAIDVTSWTFDPDDGRPYVPIGRPIWNTRIDLRDHLDRPAPAAVPGEIVISGIGVALGYVGDGTLDAGHFVTASDGERAYRTGDLARWRADGTLEFLGRLDSQIKVNGQRIELEEIESALLRCHGVTSAAVLHSASAPPAARMSAYLTAAPGTDLDARDLRDALARDLPTFMLPTRFLLAAALPQSASGKLDRAALATTPAEPLPETGRRAPAPSGPRAALLARHVAELLGLSPDRIAGDTDLFHIGLDSITVLQLIAALHRDGLTLTTADVFERRTLDRLVRLVEDAPEPAPGPARGDGGTLTEEWAGQRVVRRCALSKLQQGQLFHHDVSDDYLTYVTTVELTGPLDTDLLRVALDEVTEHHEMLRTAIDVAAPDGPEYAVLAAARLPLIEHDLRALSTREQRHALDTWRDTVRKRRFPWERAPLFEIHLHHAADDWAFLSVVEPLLDGWSVTVLVRDVLDAYETLRARSRNRPVPATAQPWRQRTRPPGIDAFIALEQEAERSDTTREFWRARLASDEDTQWRLALAKGNGTGTGTGTGTGELHRHDHVCSEEDTAALLDLAHQMRVPLKCVLLAAHLRMVSLFSGGGRTATGVLANGRPEHEGAVEMCGLFLNILPLTATPTAARSWAELIAEVQAWEGATWRHRRLPYTTILSDAGVDGMDTVFNFTNFHRYADVISDEGRSVRMGDLVGLDQTYFALTVQCSLDPDGRRLALWVENRSPAIGDDDALRMRDYLVHLLRLMVADPQAAPADTPLTAADLTVLNSAEAVGADRERPAMPSLPAVVDEHARTRPDAVAITDDTGDWTYAQVARGSVVCARAILAARRDPQDDAPVVAVLGRRTARHWVAVLAVWRAGGTYLPVASDLPSRRVAEVLRAAGTSVVVTDDSLSADLRAELVTVDAPTVAVATTEPATTAPPDGADEDPSTDLFTRAAPACPYIVFTSGSTGEPKGARIGHPAMVNHLMSKTELLGLGPADAVAQNAPASFDQSLWQCIAPWLVGGKVVVVSDALMLSPARLVDTLATHGATVFETVPSHLAVLLEAVEARQLPWPRPDLALRYLMVSGEALPADLAVRWFKAANCPLINAYGATECADDFTHAVLRGPQYDDPVPIGTPIPHCRLEVVDPEGRPLPLGVAGELRVSGRVVGLGYVDPAHESGRFVAGAAGSEGTGLQYRTGDLVRFDGSRGLVWLSRLDDEVKIHGQRMNLGEIEHHLRGYAHGVEAAVVVVRRGEGRRLRAVVAGAGAADPEALRAHLEQLVPAWMLPDEILIVPRMPLTPHGKADRKALKVLPGGTSAPGSAPAPSVPPTRTPVAGAVATAAPAEGATAVGEVVREEWARILGRPPGPDADFFREGGASLDSVRLAGRVGARLGVEVDAATVLRAPRFEAFVRAVSSSGATTLHLGAPPATPRAEGDEQGVRYVTAAAAHELLGQLPGGRLDAAAIGYVSAPALGRTPLKRDEVLAAVRAAGPLLRRVFVTPAGNVGHLLVPLVASELFVDPGMTAAVVAQAVREAGAMGARCTALTGLLASSVDYGRALATGVVPGSVTTGHDVTASAVVMNVRRALSQTGTSFTGHTVAMVGLGSIGRASARLAVDVLGSPQRLTLVESPGGLDRAERTAKELAEAGCTTHLACLESAPNALPDPVYDASLVIGAASTTGLLDIGRLAPGTIVVDDSAPHIFDVPQAVARHEAGDIYATEGGTLHWPAPLSELRWRPTDPALASLIGTLRSYRRGSSVMGCLVAGVLRTTDTGPAPVIGQPASDHLRYTYDALTDQGFTGTAAILQDRVLRTP